MKYTVAATCALLALSCGQTERDGAEGTSGTGGDAGGAATSGAGGAHPVDAGSKGGAGGAGGAAASAGVGGAMDAAVPTQPPCPPPAPVSAIGEARPSCIAGLTCACGMSCCEERLVPGGWFPMGRSLDGTDAYATDNDLELPEHPRFVSDFYLDTFEVTVSRFRQFVGQYPESLPQVGEGEHPKIPGTGWHGDYFARVPETREALEEELHCGQPPPTWPPDPNAKATHTWTAEPGERETHPISCITWYLAFAFCVWDSGRLATEGEWEYAAAGGEENRQLPWGGPYEAIGGLPIADFLCSIGTKDCLGSGSATRGYGRWGHLDLAGSVYEWTLDTFDPYDGKPCADCAAYDPTLLRHAGRGGSWAHFHWHARAAARHTNLLDDHPTGFSTTGIRCARSP